MATTLRDFVERLRSELAALRAAGDAVRAASPPPAATPAGRWGGGPRALGLAVAAGARHVAPMRRIRALEGSAARRAAMRLLLCATGAVAGCSHDGPRRLELAAQESATVAGVELTHLGCGHTMEEGGHRIFATVGVRHGAASRKWQVMTSEFGQQREDFGLPWRVVSGCQGLDAEAPLTLEAVEVRSADQCAELCQASGLCTVREGRCVASADAHCKESAACRAGGRCRLDGDHCVVRSEADCAASEGCERFGACALQDGACRPGSDGDCRRSPACRDDGACAFVGSRCTPTSSADCKAATGCAARGACALGTGPYASGRCVPATDDDCRQSRECKEQYRCQKGDYGCVGGQH